MLTSLERFLREVIKIQRVLIQRHKIQRVQSLFPFAAKYTFFLFNLLELASIQKLSRIICGFWYSMSFVHLHQFLHIHLKPDLACLAPAFFRLLCAFLMTQSCVPITKNTPRALRFDANQISTLTTLELGFVAQLRYTQEIYEIYTRSKQDINEIRTRYTLDIIQIYILV